MLAVTISNNTTMFYGIFDLTNEMLAANEALAALVKMKLDFSQYTIVPLPDAAEIGLDNIVGMLIEDNVDPYDAVDDSETFYVQVSKYYLGTMKCCSA